MNTNKTLLKSGNKKLDNSVLTFSLPPIKTCPNCSSCMHDCYAMKAWKQYPTVKEAWTYNYEMTLNTDEFIEQICYELQHTRKTQVRVHVSGDFYSIDYIIAWAKIARMNPHIKFWTYTKTWRVMGMEWDNALNALNSLPNFNIVDSMPLGCLNFGTDEYITNFATAIESMTGEKTFICPCGHNDSIKCGKDCNACAECKYVLFKQH